jgi:hypothetical protein
MGCIRAEALRRSTSSSFHAPFLNNHDDDDDDDDSSGYRAPVQLRNDPLDARFLCTICRMNPRAKLLGPTDAWAHSYT